MSIQIFVTLAALVTLALAQSLTVNTPTSVQACLPVAITWTGGVPPVYVSLIPGGQPGGSIIKDFGSQNTNSLTWNVDQPVGSNLSVQIRDSTGAINYSDKFTVQPSTETCKTADAGAAGGANASPTKPGATTPSSSAPNTTKPGTPPAATTSSTTSGSSAPGTTAAGSSNTAPTSGGSPANQASSSNAPRTIPEFFVLALTGALAIFA